LVQADSLSDQQREQVVAPMRVNHVGVKVCAQALYEGHALSSADPSIVGDGFRRILLKKRQDDTLPGLKERIDQLAARTSVAESNLGWRCACHWLFVGSLWCIERVSDS
jgi:demethoxyubiquinone hydroxylase (CLK1/Coq7/Cat5 family)